MKTRALTMRTYDDHELWNKLKAGEEKSFSLLFEKYYGDLISYGNSFYRFPERVEDCVQDVFADVWLYRESLQEPNVVKAYLLSSVRKRIARLYERDRIFRKTTTTDSIEFLFDFSVEKELIEDEEIAESVFYLNKLLNDLPPRQKEALFLRYSQGLGVEEIAEMLDVNYQSAKNILHRGLLTLRKEWKGSFSIIALLSSSVFKFI
ncbi:RNA polymerase sigma factor [Flavobacterium sp. CLA17]|uniref:RNA polymerase sigma factor n=1 Tax=Flavobacterium sp. CLA17 TaxID=2724135 RepID=UPI001490B3C9|nr:sigma-70 family RNA polymerase sigma factor [Flavobacterium sp. CLA17]QSB26333.1 sigma-70 family RNA polymerase sigma factor [Flavobacterium sp. CLA17]